MRLSPQFLRALHLELFTKPSFCQLFTKSSLNEVYLSAVSAWEIALKHALGRLPLPEPPERFIPSRRKQHGIDTLPLEEEAALHLTRLPPYHQDPFDRMLICQAVIHGMVLLTPDELILQYSVRTTW